MSTLANGEDPDEMPHDSAFHQGLHCLLRQNLSSEKETQFYLETITYALSMYTMDYPEFIVLFDFSLTVKAAPHEWVIRTGQP